MADYKLIGDESLPPSSEIGTITEGIGFPLRPVEPASSGTAMPPAPPNQYSVGINGAWINALAIAGSPAYIYTEVGIVTDGQLQLDNNDPSLATQITVSKAALSGAGTTAALEKLEPNAVVSIVSWLDNTTYLIADVSSFSMDAGLNYQVPISPRSTNGTFAANTPVIFSILPFAPTPVAPAPPPPQLLNIVASGKDPDGGDFLGFGSELQGSNARYVSPFNGTIDDASIGRTDQDNSDIQVRVNGVVITELFTTDRETTYTGLGINILAGDYIEARVKPSSNKINNPILSLILAVS